MQNSAAMVVSGDLLFDDHRAVRMSGRKCRANTFVIPQIDADGDTHIRRIRFDHDGKPDVPGSGDRRL